MATIPIEVIVQDAESPVAPTPVDPADQGENTNIIVPDTGAGIVDNNNSNSFTGSSAAISIVSIVIAVLAIGAVIALLVRRYYKRKNLNTETGMTRQEKRAMAATSTIAVLAVTVLIGNLVIPATKAATSDIEDGITPAEDKVSIVVTRDDGVAEASIESTATITSTSDFGYKVLLSMAEGVETSNLYLDGDTTSQYFIASVEAENEERVELAENTWGYALTEGGEYSAVPLVDDAATVAQGDEPVEDELLSIYYGVKVSSGLPAGTYSGGEIEYNFVELEPAISDLIYMQDFATLTDNSKAGVLNSMVEDEQYVLKDVRDEKPYYIAKLKDGNVWMTQNLDLDIEPRAEDSIIYDSTTTDLPANTSWEPDNGTISFTGDTVEGWGMNYVSPYSADPGEVYTYSDQTYTSEQACLEAGHTDCKHHHVGNYYNWPAAVATNDASGFTEGNTNAPTSICPAGWRLPRGRTGDGSWAPISEMYVLLAKYITFGSPTPRGYPVSTEAYNTIISDPIWLTPRSEGIDASGAISNYGYTMLWTATIVTSERAASIVLKNDSLDPDGHGNRFAGSSVRCLVQ